MAKEPELQLKILKKVCTSECSQASLAREFGHISKGKKTKGRVDISQVRDALEILYQNKHGDGNHWIKLSSDFLIVNQTLRRGKFLFPTDKGLDEFLKIANSLEFWEMLFYVFTNRKIRLTKTVNEIVTQYYDKLSIPVRYILPRNVSVALDHFKQMSEKNKNFYKKIIPILEFLGEHGITSEQKLSTSISNKEARNYYDDYGIYELKRRGLIIQIDVVNSKIKLCLSHLGLLLLVNHYFEKFKISDLLKKDYPDNFFDEFMSFSPSSLNKKKVNNENEEKLLDNINKIMSHNGHLFPRIFNKKTWKILSSQIGVMEIIQILVNLFFQDTVDKFSSRNGNTMHILYEQLKMDSFYNQLLGSIQRNYKPALAHWQKSLNCKFPIFDSRNNLSETILNLGLDVDFDDYSNMQFVQTHNGMIITSTPEGFFPYDPNYDYEKQSEREFYDDKTLDSWASIQYDVNKGIQSWVKRFVKNEQTNYDGVKFDFLSKVKKLLNDFEISEPDTHLKNLEYILDDIFKIVKISGIINKISELEIVGMGRDLLHIFDAYESKNIEHNQNNFALQNVISFRFFTYFRSLYLSEFDNLIENDKQLKKWYDEWLHQIDKFSHAQTDNLTFSSLIH